MLWCPAGARGNSYELLGHDGLRAIQETGCNLIVKLHDHPHLPKGMTWDDVAPLLVAATAHIFHEPGTAASRMARRLEKFDPSR